MPQCSTSITNQIAPSNCKSYAQNIEAKYDFDQRVNEFER